MHRFLRPIIRYLLSYLLAAEQRQFAWLGQEVGLILISGALERNHRIVSSNASFPKNTPILIC